MHPSSHWPISATNNQNKYIHTAVPRWQLTFFNLPKTLILVMNQFAAFQNSGNAIIGSGNQIQRMVAKNNTIITPRFQRTLAGTTSKNIGNLIMGDNNYLTTELQAENNKIVFGKESQSATSTPSQSPLTPDLEDNLQESKMDLTADDQDANPADFHYPNYPHLKPDIHYPNYPDLKSEVEKRNLEKTQSQPWFKTTEQDPIQRLHT